MHLTLISIGSRGDIQPFMALAIGLKAAGHSVRVATHQLYAEWVQEQNLEFLNIEGNPREMLETEAGQAWMNSGLNLIKFVRNSQRLFEPVVESFLPDLWQACQNTDAVIFSTLGSAAADFCKRLNIPAIAVHFTPIGRTSEFSIVGSNLGRPLNYTSNVIGEYLLWLTSRSAVNRWRKQKMNFPPLPLASPYDLWLKEGGQVLYGYSPSVLPKPADWREGQHVTGYWFLEQAQNWSPPQALIDFLADGPAPIYIGFGSMSNRQPEQVTEIALQALKRTGQRGLFLTGWGGISNRDLPQNVFKIDSVPHDWLFPRMSAIVHHGGAGTTSAALKAGVPSVAVTFFADQPFWGRRIYDLGVAAKPLPIQRLTVDRLTAALQTITTDPIMRAKAAHLGQKIRTEHGVSEAVRLINQLTTK